MTTLAKSKKILQALKAYLYQPYDSDKKPNKAGLIGIIILLMSISQLAMTIYLPSLPIMADFYGQMGQIELTLTVYVLSYGLSQFVYGPLSDLYGRRFSLLIGLSIFIVGSLFSCFAVSLWLLMVARVLQGLGMGCGDTMGRAILCDCFDAQTFVKAASYIGMAAVVMPIVGPVVGAYIQHYLHWRGIFVFLLLYGCLSFHLVARYLPETNRQPSITTHFFKETLNKYRFIISRPVFLGYYIPGLVAALGEIIYSMTSPFLMQVKLGWSPIAYSWLSAISIGGVLLGALVAHFFSEKIDHYKMVLFGLYVLMAAGITMLLWGVYSGLQTMALILPMTLYLFGTGIVYPNTNSGALAPFSTMAGTAGALQGGMQMVATGVLSIVASDLSLHNQVPLSFMLIAISFVGYQCFVRLVGKEPG